MPRDGLLIAAMALTRIAGAGAVGFRQLHEVYHSQQHALEAKLRLKMTEAKSLRKASSDRQGADLISSLEMEAAQEEISELRDQIQRMQHKPKDKDRLSVLAVVAHHVPAKAGGEARRNSALKETLKAMQEWPLTKMTTYVLTNKLVENAHVKDMVTGQILVSSDEPVCSETWKHKFCVPWEAIRALRSASAGGEPTTKLGFELVGEPKFDFYVYTESDIIIPEPTFHFWHSHVDALYKRGYLLLPMRAEDKLLTNDVIAVDCFDAECVNKTEVLKDDDKDSLKLYKTSRDRHYLRPYNPYSGCFLMNKDQFTDFLHSPMWDYHKVRENKFSPWGVRETAASGLLWAPGFGKDAGLTHLKMKVWHQIPMNGVGKGDPKARIDPSRFHRVDEYHDKVSECLNGTLQCGQLTPLRHL